MARHSDIADRLILAAEQVIRSARAFPDVSVRRIASAAETNVSAISYHFGSLEELAIVVGTRAYRQLNLERLTELQAAQARHAPNPPPVEETLTALIGPSIRWSMDPASPYPVFTYLNRLAAMSDHPERFRNFVETVEHHRAFVATLRRAAPWFDETEIAWRLNAALGIRSQLTRSRHRSDVLTGHRMDLSDPDKIIPALVEIIVPMFADPVRLTRVQTLFDKRHRTVTDSH